MKHLLLVLLWLSVLLTPLLAQDLRPLAQEASVGSRAFEVELEALRSDPHALRRAVQALEKSLLTFEQEEKALRQHGEEYRRMLADESNVSESFRQLQLAEQSIAVAQSDFSRIISEYPVFRATHTFSDHAHPLVRLTADYRGLIDFASHVRRHRLPIFTSEGLEAEVDILTLGTLATYSRQGEDFGIVQRNDDGRLQQIAWLPAHENKQIAAYFRGVSDVALLDFTHGTFAAQWQQPKDPIAHVARGGILMYPIAAVACFAFVLILERLYSLYMHRPQSGVIAEQVIRWWRDGGAAAIHAQQSLLQQTAVGRVALEVVAVAEHDAALREQVMNEALLREVPALERNIALLAACAAVAPLLGLLGTVMGMIETFQVITLHGSGDPRLMAGGISQALITTMYGLGVAIPVMLVHTLLARRSERLIDELQEAGMSMANAVAVQRAP
ncbi:MotA/TolQ/ExbB proton channel family protein [Chrysiogenes arsenatis]|uniref:MotA/TolQ/ExbB proton channel family protein n=1 Tax=Chrysiogenes arsenatis TaxID=309797 RepID=UPI00040C4623|nr:MotA/TolQ/ExbB proton channel family protein [Chrysiogenes arsenatis]